MATPAWDQPCSGQFAYRRNGAHSLQRVARGPRRGGFCRDCGAREPGKVSGDQIAVLEAAILAFRDACDALEPLVVGAIPVIRTELDQQRVSGIARWRAALNDLRKAEAIG